MNPTVTTKTARKILRRLIIAEDSTIIIPQARHIHYNHRATPVLSTTTRTKRKGPLSNKYSISPNRLSIFAIATIMTSSGISPFTTMAHALVPRQQPVDMIPPRQQPVDMVPPLIQDDLRKLGLEKGQEILDTSSSVATTAMSSFTSPEEYHHSLRKVLVSSQTSTRSCRVFHNNKSITVHSQNPFHCFISSDYAGHCR